VSGSSLHVPAEVKSLGKMALINRCLFRPPDIFFSSKHLLGSSPSASPTRLGRVWARFLSHTTPPGTALPHQTLFRLYYTIPLFGCFKL
jgi:hypothetical protein